MTSYARLLPGQGPGLAGLQQQPAGVQDQIQQLQNAQAPANYRSLPQVNQLQGFQNLQDSQPQQQSGRDGYINSKLSVGFFGSPEAMQQAKEQFGKDYDADPSIYQPQQGGQPQFGGDPYAPGGPLGDHQFFKQSSTYYARADGSAPKVQGPCSKAPEGRGPWRK